MRNLRSGLFVALIWLLPTVALADWDPTDGHKMHFPQLPDESGWAVNATQPLVLADDWQCSETGWVKDVHFWGAWKGGIEGQIQSFVLSIHADIPADQSPTGYSMPGATLWEQTVSQWIVQPIDPPTLEGWYDPQAGLTVNNDHDFYYQYNVFLPRELWFHQVAGTIYWLNISAIVVGPTTAQWGWKSTDNHFNDDAVWALWGALNWQELFEPEPGPTTNAFNISIDPVGNFLGGSGSGAYGNGWYLYPSGWWNIWFYDEPLKLQNQKLIHIDMTIFPVQPMAPSQLTVALNWSTDVWSQTGNPPGDRRPPLPGEDEAAYIGRSVIYSGPVAPGQPIVWDGLLPIGYCPEWVSVDVQGFNFTIENGHIMHDCLGQTSLDLSFVITGGRDVCEFYKAPYPDYAPVGMPDFDQKQDGWIDPLLRWTHCGPVALANCLWWFDSKNEVNQAPPPAVIDNYPLVRTYATMPPFWDDHDPMNVIPLVDSLAKYCGTNLVMGGGTFIHNLVIGTTSWLNKTGLASQYTVRLLPLDNPQSIDTVRAEVKRSRDVILLLGFWEINAADPAGCHRVGGHYVTVAGVCTTETAICISDPWLDYNEGEPPAGSAHGSAVHNDAAFVSGPHGTIDHDKYSLGTLTPSCAAAPFRTLLRDYPMTASDINQFAMINNGDIPSQPYTGGQIVTVLEYAVIICPVACDCRPGDADNNGAISIADVVYLINYIFAGGAAPAPYPICSGDANCNCSVSIADAVYMINYIFSGGAAPCSCADWLGICGPPLR